MLAIRPVLHPVWRMMQVIVWLLGIIILYCLFFIPQIGIQLFWNMLIPVAPLLFVVALGIWRNLCPLALTNLLPRHWGVSRRKKMSPALSGFFSLVAVVALFIIVPLRHPIFNNNGVATGLMIISMSAAGFSLGFIYEWKSAWCSGLCPVQPVERLYGGNVLSTFPNAHCDKCQNCVIPCPDSTPHFYPGIAKPSVFHRTSNMLVAGGLPGFIWGWFQIPDSLTGKTLSDLPGYYKLPMAGLFCSLLLFMILERIIPSRQHKKLVAFFAAASVSCYYWYRIPSLLGFGQFAGDGQLVDLSDSIPAWTITAMVICSTIFFFYWLVIRNGKQHSWVKRPPMFNGKMQ